VAHTYASVAAFNDTLTDAGSTKFATEDPKIVRRKLAVLEAVSRDIDQFCGRSLFGSGFGPRFGTNRYSGDDGYWLDLEDDLLSVTSLSTRAYIGATPTLFTEETDYVTDPYDSTPKRRIYSHGLGTGLVFLSGERTVEITGKWGYADERETMQAATSEPLDTTETTVDVTVPAEFSPGQTFWLGTEMLYVRSIAGSTLTVERGANGSTAATHDTSATPQLVKYPPSIEDTALQLAQLRWGRRSAGVEGDSGDAGTIRPYSEEGIKKTALSRFKIIRIY
jgi:hypothetical protein